MNIWSSYGIGENKFFSLSDFIAAIFFSLAVVVFVLYFGSRENRMREEAAKKQFDERTFIRKWKKNEVLCI